jgi:hypothetical protein
MGCLKLEVIARSPVDFWKNDPPRTIFIFSVVPTDPPLPV